MRRVRSQQNPDGTYQPAATPAAVAREPRVDPLAELQARAGNEVVNHLVDGHLQSKLAASGARSSGRSGTRSASALRGQTGLTAQPSMTVGAAHDLYEREADRIAETVLRRLRDHQPGSARSVDTSSTEPPVQRVTPLDDGARHGGGQLDADEERAIRSAGASGRPLEDDVRAEMERGFGVDLGAVRIHTDARADTLNRSLASDALTSGRDIFFRSGNYAPRARRGAALLAHELAHTIQQGAVGESSPIRRSITTTTKPKKNQAANGSLREWGDLQRDLCIAADAAVPSMLRTPGGVVQRGGTGLASEKASKKYAKGVKETNAGWDSLSERERIAALLDPANVQLAKAKVPTVHGIVDPLGSMQGTATHAGFNRSFWQVWFNPDYLRPGVTKEQFGRIANTTYHECRHAEQTFRVARKLAAEGKNPTQIAQLLSIPEDKARLAAGDPLSPKKEKEWSEAKGWQLNMEIVEHGKSRAELVNEQSAAAMAAYFEALGRWREIKRLQENDPKVDPRAKQWYDGELLKSGGAARVQMEFETRRNDYIAKRERARGAYLQYAYMPVEEDAWATGALIQKHLGLDPSTPEKELENLEKDERTITPLLLLALKSGSTKEQQLFSALKQAL